MKQIRCAIYTRKSTNEGLDQEFNSLDAQREACEAYVRSQRGEGWLLHPERYDDGGFSGGTAQRPALIHLLDDVRAGKVDMIVIYKIDRLTRSLADFAKMVETFDGHGCSFVSITQSFNTQTSMGRLTLNMLLSFAQFEREVGSERIRDKIASTKAKGMWTGGLVPLGYDAVDRQLVVNREEAKQVRSIMRTFLKVGTVRGLLREINNQRILTKRRAKGRGGTPFQKTALYTLLKNETYLGRIKHGERSYAGRHTAIVSRRLWDDVQRLLQKNAQVRRTRSYGREPSLLSGMIFDDSGERVASTHTNKHGRRYHYYATDTDRPGGRASQAGRLRTAAKHVDAAVRDQLLDYLNDKTVRAHARRQGGLTTAAIQSGVAACRQLARQIEIADKAELRALLMELGTKVHLKKDAIRVEICGVALARMTLEETGVHPDTVVLEAAGTTLRRRGSPNAVISNRGAADAALRTKALSRLLAKAFVARADLFDKSEFANPIKPAQLRLARLAFLAPDIVTRIIAGQSPATLTARRLYAIGHLPPDWQAQRDMLGFG